jgi:hypothetical protein
MSSTIVSANDYSFVRPIDGLVSNKISPEEEARLAWESFAEQTAVTADADWNNLVFNTAGITEVPQESYPNPNPSGNISTKGRLQSIGGLSVLETVGQTFDLSNNKVSDVSEFNNLKSVGSNLILRNNPITDLSGFDQPLTIGNQLNLSNTDLTNLSSLDVPITVNGDLRISPGNLTSLSGFSKLDLKKGAYLMNNQLANVDGLRHLTRTNGNYFFQGNPLESIWGLGRITDFGGSLGLHGYQGTHLNDFASSIRITYSLYLVGAPRLKDLSALSRIKYLGSRIYIDRALPSRSGYIPPAKSSWICQPSQSDLFPPSTTKYVSGGKEYYMASQSAVCKL